MADAFADRFAAVRGTLGPLVLGADPHGRLLRDWGLADDAAGLERFTDIVLAAAAGSTGLLKPQSAFYERHGWPGIRALDRLIRTARAQGLLVILDVKRGDVGSTNAAYAAAYLGDDAPLQADAVTVSPYLGLAATGEFTRRAHQPGRSQVLSGPKQALPAADNRNCPRVEPPLRPPGTPGQDLEPDCFLVPLARVRVAASPALFRPHRDREAGLDPAGPRGQGRVFRPQVPLGQLPGIFTGAGNRTRPAGRRLRRQGAFTFPA
ncbi:MAG TPA: orotidine-5'-phosphate decarboxylase [Trebonia sp.]